MSYRTWTPPRNEFELSGWAKLIGDRKPDRYSLTVPCHDFFFRIGATDSDNVQMNNMRPVECQLRRASIEFEYKVGIFAGGHGPRGNLRFLGPTKGDPQLALRYSGR